jgi:predicted ATPase
MLNRLEYLGNKPVLLENLKLFYNDVEDYTVTLHGGTAQLYFRESGLNGLIPATRLSDGTLRYLFLLCILLHPLPPPVICIDEPELGLHPDILPTISRLLIDASERCQLIVTTHSSALIDSLSHKADCVLVAEKEGAESTITRLNKDELTPWLNKYRLGELWIRGEIGGNIW